MRNKRVWTLSAAAGAVVILGGAGIATAVADHNERPLEGSTLEQAREAALAELGAGTVTDAETSDDAGSAYEVEVRLDNGEEIDVELDDAFEVVHVEQPDRDDDDDSELPLSGTERANAERAALNEVGAGVADDVERSDDAGSAYEVEVRLDNGDEVDVELDDIFAVLRVEAPEHDD